MGKTKDKNNLGCSLTNSKKPPKPSRSQKAKMSAAKVLGHSSITDQNNLNEVIDKLDYVSMMTSNPDYVTKPKESVAIEEGSDCSEDYEDVYSGDEEEEMTSDVDGECSRTNITGDGEATLVIRYPDMEGPISKMERELAHKESEDKRKFLVIPRRPKWTPETKPDQLTLMESQSFAEWKYKISQTVQMLKHCATTPFERNLDFWRQLWRVVERSDIVAQIVDARNPLLFFTEDLYAYCSEFENPKKFFLLINKADFLTEDLRKMWASYFNERNIKFKFFCALNTDQGSSIDNSQSSIISGNELIQFIKSVDLECQLNETYRTCGFIGYPNVGKSSTINHLVGASKTSTSATPGKTKHFQTLFIDSNLCLCDCPGLVMPNFVKSKSDLLTNGILPIDQANELVSPIELIGQQVGWENLCRSYGFSSDRLTKLNSEGFLSHFAVTRGYGTSRGNPDLSTSAKHVLKDFVNGKIVFCHKPPSENEPQKASETNTVHQSSYCSVEAEILPAPLSVKRTNEALEARIDSQFFASAGGNAHMKGRAGSQLEDNGKLSKKHHNRNKKEKLRKVYRDLDAY